MTLTLSALIIQPEAERAKRGIEQMLHLHRDAIHIYIGGLLFVGAALYFRGRWTAVRLLGPGIVIAVMLEVFDLIGSYSVDGNLYWALSLKDVLNTNLLPFIVYVTLLRSKRASRDVS